MANDAIRAGVRVPPIVARNSSLPIRYRRLLASRVAMRETVAMTTTTVQRIADQATRQQFKPVSGWYMFTPSPHIVIVSLIDSSDHGMVETIATAELVQFVMAYPFTIERHN